MTYTSDGYDTDDDYAVDPLDMTGDTKPWAAMGEISYYVQGLRDWPAKLLNGTLYIFKPGHKYDITFIRDDGWIEQYFGVIYMGNDSAPNIGKFLTPAVEATSRKPTTPRVIVAARLSSLTS